MDNATLMQKAKARMLLKHVFFATLVISTRLRPAAPTETWCRTAATNGLEIVYSETFIDSLEDLDVVMFVLAHEVMHIMFKHSLRRNHRHHARWNIACDFAINLLLKRAGFKVWQHALCDEKYAGMSAEQIYDEREKEREKQGKKGGKPPKNFGDGGRPGEGTPDNGADPDEYDEGGLGGDILDPDSMTPDELAEVERQINQRVAQASAMARAAGQMPSEIERVVANILNPPLPWRQLLREYMTATAADDENWTRRNRRFSDYCLPARWSEAMGEIVIIGDTSGSMGDEIFGQIATEINEIREQLKPERVRVIWADDAACSREEVFEADQEVELHPKGGGGTDMRKPLRFVEKYDPLVCILITDGDTPWPVAEPDYPLIVILTRRNTCPIGRVIEM